MRVKFVHHSLKISMRIAAAELLPQRWERVSEPEGNKSNIILCIEPASVDIKSQTSSLFSNPETLPHTDYLPLISHL
jgi:hypothetical protein